MESSEPPSLGTQIFELQTRHRSLDVEIADLHLNPYLDQLQLQRLKKQKLRLKENIQHLKNLLIPDLDA